ncbi:protein PTCD3 homolog, mitochondrial isoform X2 [Vespula pensylvanica]|uniref:Small ribosomal subunit protein mS39 n=1 Tax=Vespula pensylvanica TaxID=30213 RepID=A0A834MYU9_VESPE|nr:protein PTCD3 homolog, mitochondrial isoform X2 [Vespula pensylvanica]KAF7389570.1 hypothetical protein H0235_018054 [Vespula pensylvanica]
MNVLTNTSCRVANKIIRRLQSSSSTASSTVDIKIPDRIERGPTDILRALERTISRDPFTPHYKYYDDPYLIPTSKQTQRQYALSFESGRKTGIWVHQEHAELFRQNIADPTIQEFMPPATYTKKEQVSEEILLSTISEGKTLEALEIYKLLEENVSIKAKQFLLELLCFSNSSNLKQFTFQEESWYMFVDHEKKKHTWKQAAEIKELFNFLISQDAETAAAAYNTLICGKAKYLQTQEAWSLFLQCKENKIPLNVNAYNAIIRIIPYVREVLKEPTSEVFKILKDMNANGIHPNLATLNSSLEIIYTLRSYKIAAEFTYSLLEEFKLLEIKPSLTTYCHILFLENQDSETLITVLEDMLNVLEKNTLELRDSKDINFFPTAMEIVRRESNLELGEKLHELLLKDDNYKFIANAYSENVYYRHYVFLKLAMLPIEKFFEFYYKLSTHIYMPETSIMENILITLQLQSKEVIIENLPKLLSQIKIFTMLDNEHVTKVALDIACRCDIESESPLHKVFASFALDIWHFKQSKSSSIRQVLWNVVILKDIALVLLRASWYNEASEIISFIISHEAPMMGALNVTQINELLEICILQGYASIALHLIKYAMKFDLEETAMMARRVYNVIPLTVAEKEKLISLVGSDVLQLQLSDQH